MDRRRFVLASATLGAVAPPGAVLRHGPGAAAQERPAAGGSGVPGWGSMQGDLVLIGPASDPARVAGLRDTAEALRRIAAMGAPFVSRGDHGGAREAELRLWRAAGVDPVQGRGRWYREVNGGTGAALDAAAAQNAYTLADRGAWLALRDRRNLRIVVEGDRRFAD